LDATLEEHDVIFTSVKTCFVGV